MNNYMYKKTIFNDIVDKLNGQSSCHGMTKMFFYNLHPDFRSEKILSYVRNMINDNDYSSFSNLTEDDKIGFLVLLDQMDDDRASRITEATWDHFRMAVKKHKYDDATNILIKALVIAYTPMMETIFEYVLEGINSDKRNINNL